MNQNLSSLMAQLPGYWGCKDLNSVFVCANLAYANLVGFDTVEQLIGKADYDVPCQTANCAKDFQQQDQYVVQTGRSLKVLDIHPYPDGSWHAHIFTKKPWLDEHGKIQGSIFYGQDLTETAILEVGHWVCRATGLDDICQLANSTHLQHAQEKLTQREQEALFLLLYGKKPTYIASAMNISIKTLESYVARLRAKFGAHSKAHLIDLALERGYGSVIPQSLLKKQLSVILHNEPNH